MATGPVSVHLWLYSESSYKYRDFPIIWEFGRDSLATSYESQEVRYPVPWDPLGIYLGLAKYMYPPRTFNPELVMKDEGWWEEIVLAPRSSSGWLWRQYRWWHPCHMFLSSLQIILPVFSCTFIGRVSTTSFNTLFSFFFFKIIKVSYCCLQPRILTDSEICPFAKFHGE